MHIDPEDYFHMPNGLLSTALHEKKFILMYSSLLWSLFPNFSYEAYSLSRLKVSKPFYGKIKKKWYFFHTSIPNH